MEPKSESSDIYKSALLVAVACVLQVAESAIPQPVPGLRLGLANAITLIALVRMGFGCAMEITLLRTLLGSFIVGTFMSPGFLLSFTAGVASTAVMGFGWRLTRSGQLRGLSIVGVSILGALAHNLTQLYLAYLLLIHNTGIFAFLPWLCIGAVATGWVTGLIAGQVCSKLEARVPVVGDPASDVSALRLASDRPGLGSAGVFVPADSLLHRLPAEIKLIAVCLLSLSMLILRGPWFYAGAAGLLVFLLVLARVSSGFVTANIRRCILMLAVAFGVPAFCSPGGQVVWQWEFFRITSEGCREGSILAGRILWLVLLSSLLLRTTAPVQLGQGLSRLLAPLRRCGVAVDRLASIFSLSWSALPLFGEIARQSLQRSGVRGVKDMGRLIPLASEFITRFYLQAEVVFVTAPKLGQERRVG
ncbi:MAG: hypothetical protein HGA80_07025 [Candidatus Omnitrophica bacterium]|nr:hypothetical protein [Candidatus Omnitrophota bacterium]